MLGILIGPKALAFPHQDAVDAAARAFYQEMHWDQDVNALLQHYEKKFSKRQKEIGGYIYEVFKISQDRMIQLRWTFP